MSQTNTPPHVHEQGRAHPAQAAETTTRARQPFRVPLITGMTIGRKLGLGFGLVILLLIISNVVSYISITNLNKDVVQMAEVEEAVLKMEINVGEMTTAVLNYMRDRDPEHRERVQDSVADFEAFTAEFVRLAETDEAARLGREAINLFVEIKTTSFMAMNTADQQYVRLQAIRENVTAIEALIDDQLRPAVDRTAPDAVKKLEAALDMEIAIEKAYAAVEAYLIEGDPAFREKLDDAEQDFERFETIYRESNLSADERGWVDQIDPVFSEFRSLADELLDREDRKHDRLAHLDGDLKAIAAVLDGQIQPLVRAETAKAEEDARQTVRRTTLATVIIAIAAVIVGGGTAVTFSSVFTGSIRRLVDAAEQMRAGDLTAQARVEFGDEIGTLATSFNSMAAQLRQTLEGLEQRVLERTQQLERVVDVSQHLTGILDLGDLLREVVTLTKETFNYYHVHIYLLEGETLTMAEGYGQAGAEMKRQGHSIPLVAVQSLVARAAREGQVITVENVRDDPTWLPNPLLPDTHSEMVVPVMLGQEVVGVLDVQNEKAGGLPQEDEATLRALANQVATAVRNARAFAQTQEALYDAQKLQRLYTGQAWEKFGVTRTTDYEVRQPTLPPLAQMTTPEVTAALQQEQTVDLRLGSADNDPATPTRDTRAQSGDTPAGTIENALATPLKLGDEIIGVLGIRDDDPNRRWTGEEIALIEAVSEQMSLAIENARLFEEMGRRATREKIIADVTSEVWASGELEQVMQTAVAQLGVTLDASKVIIRLGTEAELVTLPPEDGGDSEISEM